MDITGIGSIADLIKDGIDKIFPDPAEAAKAKVAILEAENAGKFKEMDQAFQLQVEQIKANAAEAAQPGMHFRDGAGWTCVASVAYTMVACPMIEGIAAISGHPVTLPKLDSTQMWDVLAGLLGLGGMHAYENIKTK